MKLLIEKVFCSLMVKVLAICIYLLTHIINITNIIIFAIYGHICEEKEEDLDYIEGRKEGIFEMVWYRGDVGVGVRKLFFNTY